MLGQFLSGLSSNEFVKDNRSQWNTDHISLFLCVGLWRGSPVWHMGWWLPGWWLPSHHFGHFGSGRRCGCRHWAIICKERQHQHRGPLLHYANQISMTTTSLHHQKCVITYSPSHCWCFIRQHTKQLHVASSRLNATAAVSCLIKGFVIKKLSQWNTLLAITSSGIVWPWLVT